VIKIDRIKQCPKCKNFSLKVTELLGKTEMTCYCDNCGYKE